MVKRKVCMTIREKIFDDFSLYCKENGMKISTRVELLIKKDLQSENDKE